MTKLWLSRSLNFIQFGVFLLSWGWFVHEIKDCTDFIQKERATTERDKAEEFMKRAFDHKRNFHHYNNDPEAGFAMKRFTDSATYHYLMADSILNLLEK